MPPNSLEPFSPAQLQGQTQQQQERSQEHAHRRPQHRHSDAASDPFLVIDHSLRKHTTKLLPVSSHTPPPSPPAPTAASTPSSLPAPASAPVAVAAPASAPCSRPPAIVSLPLASRSGKALVTAKKAATSSSSPAAVDSTAITTTTSTPKRRTWMRSLVHRSALTELLRQQTMREQDDGDGDDNSSSDAAEKIEANGLAEVSTGLSLRPSAIKPLNKARQRHQPQPPISNKVTALPNGTRLPMKVGNVVVVSLGTIDYPRSYNTRGSAHIWPIGFTSRRLYKPVCGDFQHHVWFESTILAHPEKSDECIFRVRQLSSGSETHRSSSTSKNNKDKDRAEDAEFTGPSPSSAWVQVVYQMKLMTKARNKIGCNGPAYMALSDTNVQRCIEKCVPEQHWRTLGLQNSHPYLCRMRELYNIPNGKKSAQQRPAKRVKSLEKNVPGADRLTD